MINKNFIDYSIKLLLKNRTEYFFTFIIFTFIVGVLSAVLFISDSIKYVQWKIEGFYNFAQAERYVRILVNDDLDDESMIVSADVDELLKSFSYDKMFNFLTIEEKIPVNVVDVIPSNILSNNTIFLNSYMARTVLQMAEDEYTYLTVDVPSSTEVDFISRKILDLFPYTIVIQDRILESSYRHIFYYKGGMFMILYVVCLLSFFILLKNQISSLFGERKKEIAILRSIGFSIKDIILLKFIQNSVVSVSAFIFGIFLAYVFVFMLDAPLLKYIFLGEHISHIVFTTYIDFRMIFLMFMFTVLPYLAFVLIPAWRVAISDISEVMK